jgi:hypothetical protein
LKFDDPTSYPNPYDVDEVPYGIEATLKFRHDEPFEVFTDPEGDRYWVYGISYFTGFLVWAFFFILIHDSNQDYDRDRWFW